MATVDFNMQRVVFDCGTLCEQVYTADAARIKANLSSTQHRFTGILVSNELDQDSEGHYLIAERKYLIDNPDNEQLLQLDATQNVTYQNVTYLAIRGSHRAADWAANASAWPSFQKPGQVHSGWYSRMSKLPLSYLYDRVVLGDEIVITGHSLGGAVAQLLAISLFDEFNNHANKSKYRKKIRCITFGSPMVASGELVDRMNDTLKSRFWNFVHSEDVVPKVLTWTQHVLAYITGKVLERTASATLKACAGSVVNLVQSLMNEEMLVVSARDFGNKLGTAAGNFVRGSNFVLDLITYRPIGTFFKVNSEDQFHSLSDAAVTELFDISEFTISTRIRDAHQLGSSYMSRLNFPDLDDSFTSKVPDELTLEKPVIHELVLRDVIHEGKVSVEVKGEYLYGVRDFFCFSSVREKEKKQCGFIEHIDTRGDCTVNYISSKALFISGPTSPRPSKFQPAVGTCKFTTSSFFAWNEESDHLNVTIVHDDPPINHNNLQSMLYYACHILTLTRDVTAVSRDVSEEFDNLRNVVINIFKTVPIEVGFVFGSPLAEWWLKDHYSQIKSILQASFKGQAVAKCYSKSILEHQKEKKKCDPEFTLPMHLQKFVEDFPDLIFDSNIFHSKPQLAISGYDLMTIRDDEEADDVLVLGKILGLICHELFEARDMLMPSESKDTYDLFLKKLMVGVAGPLTTFISPIWLFFNPSGEDGGPAEASIERFLRSPHVQEIIVLASECTLLGSLALLTATAVVAVISTPIALIAGGVGYGCALAAIAANELSEGWSQRCLVSSSCLRDAFCDQLKVRYPNDASLCEKDRAFKNACARCWELTENSNVDDYQNMVNSLFPGRDRFNVDIKNPTKVMKLHQKNELLSVHAVEVISRRVKLIVLSATLKAAIKQMPIVLIRGPTESGKTALRENMRSCPNHLSYGGGYESRTSVPEIFPCTGVDSNGVPKSFCVLDTIGLGDTTEVAVRESESIAKVNDLYGQMASASIIVCSQKELNKWDVGFATSSISRIERPKPPSPSIPTMTCITKSDSLIQRKGYADPNFRTRIQSQITSALARGYPMDLRSTRESVYFPRVLAAFLHPDDPPIHDDIRGSLVLTPNEVARWVADTLHGKNL